MIKLSVKKLHEDAIIPTYARLGDAGLDLTAVGFKIENSMIAYRLGIAVAIPEGHVGLIYPRSSISKTGLRLANSVGVIDSGYRGELLVKFDWDMKSPPYQVGDRVAQLVVMPIPFVTPQVVEELSDTERGSGGFGSTGAVGGKL